MRILFSHRTAPSDEQSAEVEAMITAFLQEGHELRVIGPRLDVSAGSGRRMAAALRRWRRWRLPGALGDLAALASNLPRYVRLWAVCRKFGPELIYERCSPLQFSAARLARRRSLPYFLEVTAPPGGYPDAGGARQGWMARAAWRFVLRSAHRIVVRADGLGRSLIAAGVDQARIHVVRDGVMLDRFLPPPFSPIDAASCIRLLGVIGPAQTEPGLDDVLRAMADCPDSPDGAPLHLTLIGDGPMRAGLEQLATTLGLGERVCFAGPVDSARLPDVMADCDILLQPAALSCHAVPPPILAGMAAGRAIVALDRPCIREVLADGQTALLFDPACAGAMWGAATRLIADTPQRHRLGAAARVELERRNYTWRARVGRITDWATAEDAINIRVLAARVPML